jgi:hypothetical protein
MFHATKTSAHSAPDRGLGLRDPLIIPSRFSGPPGIGNGGYVCGRVAGHLDGPVVVTLRQPAPLDTPMTIDRDGENRVRVRHGTTLIAEAATVPRGAVLEAPDSLSQADVRAVAGRARYYADPAYPDCFVCGMGRGPGDGLRIFPGPVPGRALWAAPWTPDPSVTDPDGTVRPEVVWAALDCPSGIAAAEATDLGGDTAILLGRMTASLRVVPRAGDQCQVVAWPGGRDGRKLQAGSALLGPGGELLATASAVWLTAPRPGRSPAAGGAS